MTLDDFNMMIDDVYAGTWPRSNLTPQQKKIFWKLCEKQERKEVSDIFEQHAIDSPFACKPSDLKKALKSDTESDGISTDRIERDRDWAAHCEGVTRERDQRDQVFDQLSPEDREAHKQSCLADWRLRWMSDSPVDSVGWRWWIYRRVSAGLSPNAEPPYEIPPELKSSLSVDDYTKAVGEMMEGES